VDGDQTTQLQGLLDRMQQGDDAARQELVGLAYERLRRLAKKIFNQDYPRLHHLHGTSSILHEMAIRLLRALQEIRPSTVREFFTLAARHTRWVLLDLARRPDPVVRPVAPPTNGSLESSWPLEPADTSNDPAKIALWTEFHRAVEGLPQEERDVVDLHWYQGLTQAEAARLLGVSPKQVSLRWISARLKLARQMPGFEGRLPDGE
jgi:RNA polymerase sigma-70 factor (ECF subfamily)